MTQIPTGPTGPGNTDVPVVTLDDVRDAARRLTGVAHRTPVLRSRTLDALAGAEVHLKCENFQRVGAFKFRGAYNAVSRLSPEQLARGHRRVLLRQPRPGRRPGRPRARQPPR